jgi:hypothetical protein
MSDLSGVLRDARINELPAFLGVSTLAARESIRHQTTRWSNSVPELEIRSKRARCLRGALRHSSNNLRAKFLKLTELEPTVREFLRSPSELEEEGYSQLFFRGNILSPLNHIPRLLAIWTLLKLTIFPLMTAIMPILTIIGPYIIVKYVMKIPITFGQYLTIAQNMYFGGGGGGADSDPSIGSRIKRLVQTGLFCVTTFQSIYQPIQTAKHLRSIDVTVNEKGERLQKFIDICEEIRSEFATYGIQTTRLPIPPEIRGDKRRLVAFALEEPALIELLLELVGSWDVSVAIAVHPECVPVTWIHGSEKQLIHIYDTCDTGIAVAKQKKFSICLGEGGSPHTLLTGPNRGGKSTVLRALLRTTVLAHTYGIGIGSSCVLTPLDWVQSSLRMEDLPGSQSYFEREVHFAKLSLSRPSGTRGLVCVDELFHSTNPPDAEAASRQYLSCLWTEKQTLSVISTHIFGIVHSAPANIGRICCPAVIRSDGSIKYEYGLTDGICEVSSVNDIIGDAFAVNKSKLRVC